ncbi:MAG: hypothetical protein ACRDTD_17840 [Pseudonocardiaceae bacterium]
MPAAQRQAADRRPRGAGQWVGFPLRPAELLRALPAEMLARIAAKALTKPLRRLPQPGQLLRSVARRPGAHPLRRPLRPVRDEAVGPARLAARRRAGPSAGQRRHPLEDRAADTAPRQRAGTPG